MRKLKKGRLLSVLLALSMMLSICSPLSATKAAAGEITEFWLQTSAGEKGVDAVEWVPVPANSRYYLFIPTEMDLTETYVYFSATDAVKVQYTQDGQTKEMTLTNGMKTDVFSHMSATEPHIGRFVFLCGDQSYTVTLLKSQKVPSMYITLNKDLSYINENKENKASGQFKLVKADGTVDHESELKQLKGRGNATWDHVKKPYNIKFDDAVDLLGMGAAKGWCLIANYTDRSHARNEFAYGIALEAGIDFTSQTNAVNLYVNNEYIGVYSLTEKVDVGENNVDITKLEKATEKVNDKDLEEYERGGNITTSNKGDKKWYEIPNDPEDITGGYLLEFDLPNRYRDELCGFVTTQGQPVVSKYPEYASKKQIEYISTFVQEMEDAAYSPTGKNAKGKHYSEYIDMESLAKMYIIQEFSANLDNIITSFFIYKESDTKGDGKLHFAPVWDYDNAFAGSAGRYNVDLSNPEVIWTDRGIIYESDGGTNNLANGTPHLMNKLYNQADKLLLNEVRYQWYNVFEPIIEGRLNPQSPKSFEAMVDYKYVAVAMMDSRRWSYNSGEFESNMSRVKTFVEGRIGFFNQKFASGDMNACVYSGIEDVVYQGDNTVLPSFKLKNYLGRDMTEGVDYKVAYENNDRIGTAKVTVTGMGVYSGSRTFTFNVVNADLSDYAINPIADVTYTGKAITPAVTFSTANAQLKEGVDYTLSYENNVKAGTATVTVTGIGNVIGEQKVTFKILPASVSAFTIGKVSAKTYAGKAIKPAVNVTLAGTALKAGVDYKITYKNNNKPGTASILIEGMGNYVGSKTTTFTIGLKKVSKVTLNAKRKAATVKIKKVAGAKKYEILYATNNKFKKAKTRKVSSLKTTLKKLKSKKRYFVKVRAICGSVRGKYSKVYKVKVK